MREKRNVAVSINQQGQPKRTTVENSGSHVKTGRLNFRASANHLVTAA
jgi:hypothetical protein